MTRAERKAETRRHILAAAQEHFLKEGYVRASLDEIATTAGYSKGAVYSNFASKEDLFIEVFDQHFLESSVVMFEGMRALPTLAEKIAHVEAWMQSEWVNSTWALADLEFHVVASHNPEVAARLETRRQELLEALTEELDRQSPALGLVLPMPSRQVAEAIIMLTDGAAARATVSGVFPIEATRAGLLALLGLSNEGVPLGAPAPTA